MATVLGAQTAPPAAPPGPLDEGHQPLQDKAQLRQEPTYSSQGALSFGGSLHEKPGSGAGATVLLEGLGADTALKRESWTPNS